MKRKTIITVLTTVAVVAIAMHAMFGSIMNNRSVEYVCIDSDDNRDSLINKVYDAAHPTTMLGFRMLVNLSDMKVHTGRYTVDPDMSMLKLFRNVRGHIQEPVRVVVPVTRTIGQLSGRLSSVLMHDSAEFNRAFCDEQRCAEYGFTPTTIPAAIIPDTYEFYWDTSVGVVLRALNKRYKSFWDSSRQASARELGLSPTEVSILASIVDAESDFNPEKPRIAGLYLNRLHRDLPLQSDPTVIFAIGDFGIHRVSQEQTRFKSPYNTYVNKGLPPGPIRIPSVAGIDAVLNAEKHDYLYMCAKEDFSGSHNFAVEYSEHLKNAAKYTQALNRHGITK